MELHGLVAAFKLNGQLGQCVDFDTEMQRYDVVLPGATSKKVKPQNVRFVAKYRTAIATLGEISALCEVMSNDSRKATIVSRMKKWGCVLPTVVSGRALVDWCKLDDAAMRRKLMDSKKVCIDSLPLDDVKVVYLSLPRKRLFGPDETLDERYNQRVLRDVAPWLEKTWFHNQVYFILPFQIANGVDLPMVNRGIAASVPLYAHLADATVVALRKGDDPKGLRYAPQRLDVACAALSRQGDIFVYQEEVGIRKHQSKDLSRVDVRVSLPSRGRGDESQVELLREIETSLKLEKPKQGDEAEYLKCYSL